MRNLVLGLALAAIVASPVSAAAKVGDRPVSCAATAPSRGKDSKPLLDEQLKRETVKMVVSRANAEHYNWGDGADGWILLPAQDMTVIQERMPPHTSEVRHFHSKARQFFYVLSGELTMELEGTRNTVPASHGIAIPPAARHQAMNLTGEDLHFLVISSPTSHGDRTDVGGESRSTP